MSGNDSSGDARVFCDQELKERRQQRFAALADVVNKLEES